MALVEERLYWPPVPISRLFFFCLFSTTLSTSSTLRTAKLAQERSAFVKILQLFTMIYHILPTVIYLNCFNWVVRPTAIITSPWEVMGLIKQRIKNSVFLIESTGFMACTLLKLKEISIFIMPHFSEGKHFCATK